eukprot:TRINITY_DN35330_c1_g1_i1.p1 TRINITY_DN35330_c1_g1~~TRINITY_DN35330_c1_g1_i1.p1  ORF type:complete len:569 (-),score=50.51 TRINITY_DN35330_c1_g1_i1:36-1742(-)
MRLAKKLVKLNVSGKIFQTTRSTLLKYPNSLLATLAERPITTDDHQTQDIVEQQPVFINRPAKPFELILSALQLGKPIKVADTVLNELIATECEHYGVPKDDILLPQPQDHIPADSNIEGTQLKRLQEFYGHLRKLEYSESLPVGSFPTEKLIKLQKCKWPKLSAQLTRALTGDFMTATPIDKCVIKILDTQQTESVEEDDNDAQVVERLEFDCDDKHADSNQECIEKLKAYATAAVFGNKHDTVYDPKVRTATQIPRGRWKVDNTCRWYNLKDVGSLFGTYVDFKPHSINIYTENGHFTSHKDAVHSPGQIGTLVVPLPSKFTGGELVISYKGQQKTSTLGCGEPTRDPEHWLSGLQAVAFFSDCDHEVLPVTSGTRVTMTFDICVKARDYPRTADFSEHIIDGGHFCTLWDASGVKKELREVLQQILQDNNNPKRISFLLGHQYALEQATSPTYLKGGDKFLFETIFDMFVNKDNQPEENNTHYTISMKPVLYMHTDVDNTKAAGVFETWNGHEESAESIDDVVMGPLCVGDWELVAETGGANVGNEAGPETQWYSPTMITLTKGD